MLIRLAVVRDWSSRRRSRVRLISSCPMVEVLDGSVAGGRDGYWRLLSQELSVPKYHPTGAVVFDYILIKLPHLEEFTSFIPLVGIRTSLV